MFATDLTEHVDAKEEEITSFLPSEILNSGSLKSIFGTNLFDSSSKCET